MTFATTPSLEVGTEFRQRLQTRIPHPFPHSLAEMPALSLESIAKLAESLPAESVVYDAAVKPLVSTGDEPAFTSPREAGKLIRAIDENDSWLTLLNIEQSPDYAQMIDEQFDAIARAIGEPGRTFRRRMGFVFVSSPGSITPAHFDIEQSLCIQLRGERTLSFGSFADGGQRDEEVRRYWNGSFGRLEVMPVPQSEVRLAPGRAVYIPPYTPHWLQNGDASSLSMTLTFFNDDNESESMVQVFNERLRKLRLSPRPFGDSPRVDRVKVMAMRSYSALRRPFKSDRPTAR